MWNQHRALPPQSPSSLQIGQNVTSYGQSSYDKTRKSGPLHSDGTIYAPIDPAGSIGTIIFGNNDSNWMVGRYDDNRGLTHGLLFIPPNTYTTYDPPGSTFTSLNGINAQGEIVGRYEDASGVQHGIIALIVQGCADESTPGVTPQRQSSQAGPPPSRSQLEEPAF